MYHLLFAILSLCVWVCNAAQPTSPYPVLLIPGLSNSALQNIEWGDGIFSGHPTSRVWANIPDIADDKYEEYLSVHWDGAKLRSNFTVDYIDGVDGVDDISGTSGKDFSGFKELRKYINGWSGGVDAAPYDWRLTPQNAQLTAWACIVKSKIENLYYLYNQKVAVLAHSLGNLMATYFLQQNATFNAQYIQSYIAVSPPFGGAGLGLQAVIEGMNVIHFHDYNKTIPPYLLQNYACFPWIFPRVDPFGNNVVIKYNNQYQYTPSNISDYFLKYDETSTVLPIMNYITNLYNQSYFSLPPPNVVCHLIVSRYTPTAIGLQRDVKGTWAPIIEQVVDGKMGDGTVPYASLHARPEWFASINVLKTNVSHKDIIKIHEFFTIVGELIGTTVDPGTA